MACCCRPTCVERAAIAFPLATTGRSSQPARSRPVAARPPPQATVEELRARFAELKPKYPPSRQRFTLPPREGARSGEALANGKRLSDYGLADGSVLYFKDLGPQVGGQRCKD